MPLPQILASCKQALAPLHTCSKTPLRGKMLYVKFSAKHKITS